MNFPMRLILLLLAATAVVVGCAREEDGGAEPSDETPTMETAPADEPVADVPPAPEAPPEPPPVAAEPPAEQAPQEEPPADVAEATDDEFDAAVDAFRTSAAVEPFFDSAYGYAIFPTIGKGGAIVGGAYGKGRVYVDGELTGTTSMTQVSLGLQVGGQAYSEMIFFEDQAAYDRFTTGNFEFEAQAEAVAITASASAQTRTTGDSAGSSGGENVGVQADTKYKNGMATFIYSKGGLMAGASIGGQKFKFEAI